MIRAADATQMFFIHAEYSSTTSRAASVPHLHVHVHRVAHKDDIQHSHERASEGPLGKQRYKKC